MSKVTEEQKEDIIKGVQAGWSNRKIARAVLGSETRKSTVALVKNKYLADLEDMLQQGVSGIQGPVGQRGIPEAPGQSAALLARKGFSPEHGLNHPYPDGFKMGKTTIQRDSHGRIERTWERMTEDQERQQAIIMEAIDAMRQDIPRASQVEPPLETLSGLCNLYPLTDAHVGMLAWAEESGEDWDIKIASETLIRWMKTAIAHSPNSHTGVLCNLGDFLHFDGLDPVTPAHKHVLDADTRFTKLVRVSITLIRTMISMLLEKHKYVHVIMAEGNHDLASSVWLREMLYEMYKDEPRLTIDRNPDPYYCFVWGNTTLFFHHGHKSRMANMDNVLVSKFKSEFGNSKHVYAHCGHLHHLKMSETNLMVIEQHRTLAAKDSYASRGGWQSGRDAKVISYSMEYGEVSRITINPDMLK